MAPGRVGVPPAGFGVSPNTPERLCAWIALSMCECAARDAQHGGRGRRPYPSFRQRREHRQRFVIAAPREEMAKLRIGVRWKPRLQMRDFFRHRLELIEMRSRIALAQLAIANHREPFAQRV